VREAKYGNTGIANRTAIVNYGSTGKQTINDTVATWRDPIVKPSPRRKTLPA
jgi:hypothetical protein